MPLKFNTANGAIIVSAEDGSGDAAVTFPRSGYVEPTHTGNVSITGDLTTTGAVGITGDVEINGVFYAESQEEGEVALSSGTTKEVDCSTSNFFRGQMSGNDTYTFTNVPSAPTDFRSYSFTLKINNVGAGSYTITWPSSVKWAGGTAPDATAAGEIDYFVFTTHDGGNNWFGFQAGDAMA